MERHNRLAISSSSPLSLATLLKNTPHRYTALNDPLLSAAFSPPAQSPMSSVLETNSTHSKAACVQLHGKDLELPVLVGSEQERGIDISKLLAMTGCVTLDEGYANTRATVSRVTFLDGDRGILRYRGYGIEDLAANCDFLEVAHLLIYGELPTQEQLHTFRGTILRHTMIHEEMRKFFGGFPRDAHPMAILSGAVSALSTFYQDSLDPSDPRQVEISIHRLLAKLPTIAAYS